MDEIGARIDAGSIRTDVQRIVDDGQRLLDLIDGVVIEIHRDSAIVPIDLDLERLVALCESPGRRGIVEWIETARRLLKHARVDLALLLAAWRRR